MTAAASDSGCTSTAMSANGFPRVNKLTTPTLDALAAVVRVSDRDRASAMRDRTRYHDRGPGRYAERISWLAATAPESFTVIRAAYGAGKARHWAEQAAKVRCPVVVLLPPTPNGPCAASLIIAVAKFGLAIVVYDAGHLVLRHVNAVLRRRVGRVRYY